MRMMLWFEFRAYLRERCAPDLSHSSILKKHAAVESRMWLWLEFRASGGLRGGWSKFCRRKLGVKKYAYLARRWLENIGKSECVRMRRSRCRAKGGVGVGYTPPIQHYSTRHAGNAVPRRIQSASPIPPRQGGKTQCVSR